MKPYESSTRKSIAKIFLASLFSLALALFAFGCSSSSSSDNEAETDSFLSEIQGSYIELFPVIGQQKYRNIWIDEIQKLQKDVSDSAANAMAEGIIGMMQAEIYGEEAVESYDFPNNFAFRCNFILGVVKIKIQGNQISGFDKDGKEIFSHTYSPVKNSKAEAHVYQSEDENSGDFAFFGFQDDTPKTTFHLEFRYSDTESDVGKDAWFSGKLAYWNVGAIQEDYDDELVDKVIRLFVDENFGEEE